MIRNIDILYTMQDRVRKFKFYVEELSIVTDVEENTGEIKMCFRTKDRH